MPWDIDLFFFKSVTKKLLRESIFNDHLWILKLLRKLQEALVYHIGSTWQQVFRTILSKTSAVANP